MDSSDPSLIFGKYALIRRLAIGGMGEIFLARQTGVAGFQRLVILKSLRPELAADQSGLSLFLNEAKVAATLNHPNIVAIYEVDLYRNVYLLAMEYIEGTDLAGLIRLSIQSERKIPEHIAASLVRDAALGLDHAHSAVDETGTRRAIIHRDISPQNLMVRLDGLVKVVDFGIAKADNQARTRGGFHGKLGYVSPEQIGGQDLDGRADQYALGIVLWELLTRRRLFRGDPAELVKRTQVTTMPSPRRVDPEISRELEQIVLKMLSPRREDRFASMGEVVQALRTYLTTRGAAVEREVSAFVREVAGEVITAKTRDLTPTQVSIDGSTPVGSLRCPSCRRLNAIGAKFCADCGAGMPSTFDLRPAEAPLLSSLAGQAAKLRVSLSSEDETVTVIDGRFGRDAFAPPLSPETARTAEAQLLTSLSRTAQAHGAQIERMTPEGFTLVLSERGKARATGDHAKTVEALRAAFTESNKTQSGRFTMALGVERGTAQIRPLGKGRVRVDGHVISEARRLSAAALAEGKGDTLRVGVGASEGARPAPSVSHATIIGRQAELRALAEALSAAEEGRVATRVLCGQEGSGKSRLLFEAARLGEERGFQVVQLRGNSNHGLELVRRLVRALATRPGGARTDVYVELSKLGASTGGLHRIRSLLTGSFEDDDSITSDEKLRSDTTIGRLLAASATERPLLLIIDDFHLADTSSIELLSRLPERLLEGRVALLLGSSTELARSGPLSEHKVPLWSLPPEAILGLALARVGPTRAMELDRWLVEHSLGNPGLALALLSALVPDGTVPDEAWWQATGELLAAELPTTFDGLAAMQLERSSTDAQIFLGVAAHSGPVFSLDIVAKALGTPVDAVVEELVARGLVCGVDGDRLALAESSIRRAALDRYSYEESQRIHARLAEVLQTESKQNVRPDVLEGLARHLMASARGTTGVPAIVRSADLLRRSGAASEAAELYRGALSLLLSSAHGITEETAGSVYGVVARGVPVLARAEPGVGVDIIDRFLTAIAPELAPLGRGELIRQRALLQERRGQLGPAEEDLVRALALVDKAVDHELHATILGDLARIMEATGRLSEATALVGESLEVMAAREARNRHFYWRSLNALGRLQLQANELEKAQEMFELSRVQAERVDSAVGQAMALTNLASVEVLSGRGENATILLDRAAQLAFGASDAIGLARIEYNRGRLLLGRQDVSGARRALKEAERLSREAGWTEGRAVALQMLDSMIGS
ncbi:MAG: BREX system ATP-binding domain-containing protein [Myxococcota bacterium]